MGRVRVSVLPWALLSVQLVGASWVSTPSQAAEDVFCHMGAEAGAERYRPGVWGLVEFEAVNQTSEFVEAQSVLRFVGDPTLQYARRAVVPPKSKLRTTCPVLIPSSVPSQVRHINCLTQQVLPPPDPGARRRTAQETMAASQPVSLDHETPTVGLFADLDAPEYGDDGLSYYTGNPTEPVAPDELVYEMVIAAKRAQNLGRRVSLFETDNLPIDPACLEVIDVLVISSDSLATHPGGVALVRDWVLAGGRLWIMLDQVQPDTVAVLLGDAFTTTVIDHVRLTRLSFHNVRLADEQQSSKELELEEPVELARVVPHGVTVTTTVDGWPAAFWQSFGAGRVFFTTLGPAGWMRPTTWQDPAPKPTEESTNYYPLQHLADFAEECLVARPDAAFTSAVLEPVLTQQIGYRIVSQGSVAAILGAFCLSLLVAGLWCMRQGRLEHLLWFAPLAAAVTGGVFFAIALVTRHAVPPTAATLARVVVEPGISVGHSFGLAAMYNQDVSREPLGATRGGMFLPDMAGMSGRHRRAVWTDEGAWHWEDLEFPVGVRTAPFTCRIALDKTVDCRAHFGPDGLHGHVDGLPFPLLEDALIAVPYQNAVVTTMHADGSFQAGPDDVLARGEYLGTTFLSDRQRRRKLVYDQLFAVPPDFDAPFVPFLFGWTAALDTGFILPQPVQHGSTLLSIRLRLEPSPAGAEVRIPAPFVPYHAEVDAAGNPPVAYSNVMRTWVESKLRVTELLRFQLPREVLPMQVRRATIKLACRAPSRSLEVLAFAGDEPETVLRLSHPMGAYSCEVDRPELLQLDDTGGLRLAIRVGQDESARPRDPTDTVTWKIDSLQVEIAGTVQGE